MLPGSQNKERTQLRNHSKENVQNSPSPLNNFHPLQISPHQLTHYQQRFTGKLMLREEIPLSPKLFNLFLKKGWFVPEPAIIQKIFKKQCQRCLNDDDNFFAEINCKKCQHIHYYCRYCLKMGRVLACQPLYTFKQTENMVWPKQFKPLTWLGKLSSAQTKASQAVVEAIDKQEALLIWAVTGSGKTEMLFLGISHALEQGLRVCIASPRADVIRELLPRLQAAFQKVHVQALYGGSKDNDGTAQLILATTHQLIRYRHAFDVMIIDEVDAFPYYQNKYLEKVTSRAKHMASTIIYLTATPREAQHYLIETKQVKHVFVPVRYHLQPLIEPHWRQDVFLKRRLKSGKIPQKLLKEIQTYTQDKRQVLVFVPTIKQAEKLFKRLSAVSNAFGIEKKYIDAVHAEDPKRMLKIHLFRQKKIKLLITTTILERGVTFPSVNVYVLDAGHHVFDRAALIQISGRAGRSPVDPHGRVVFIHDGITKAMVEANKEIIRMNRLRQEVLTAEEEES